MSSVTVMTGPERRRRWPVEARAPILEALCTPGASVADVARRFDVCTSLIYKWRRDASLMSGAGGFLPAMIVDDPQQGPVGGRPSGEADIKNKSAHAGEQALRPPSVDFNGDFNMFLSTGPMSPPTRAASLYNHHDRRSATLLDALDVVEHALKNARSPGGLEVSPSQWKSTFVTLRALRKYRTDHEADESSYRLRGLTSAPNASVVAIIAIERSAGLGPDIRPAEATSDQIRDILQDRIVQCLDGVTIGRLSRTRIEIGFSAGLKDAGERLLVLHGLLELPVETTEGSMSFDIAIGFAVQSATAPVSFDRLIEQAEHALSKAQHSGAKVVAYNEVDRGRRAERVALMRDLKAAIPNGELFVCYQPKMDLRTLSVTSVEALVRWRHPVRGLVPPDEFIGLAEEGREIRDLTEFVIGEALARRPDLAKAGCQATIAVNISACLLADESFAAWAIGALDGDASGIGFEITETAVIATPERALANIHAFAKAGVTISIDDYGAGLSSLIYLKQIPAHELKIDKAFITDLTSSHRDPLLVRSTIDLGHALGMKVTAEGVDNARSFALLQVMGCDVVQGYHVSKPLMFHDLLEYLQQFNPDVYKHQPLFGSAG